MRRAFGVCGVIVVFVAVVVEDRGRVDRWEECLENAFSSRFDTLDWREWEICSWKSWDSSGKWPSGSIEGSAFVRERERERVKKL